MRTFNVGLLGCGVISRTYAADIRAFFPRLKLVACADVNLALAEKLAREFDIPKACLTEELLRDESVEIVVNLTPPQLHVALDERIIAAGKHLFSEKPFAPSVAEAEAVLARAKAASVCSENFWFEIIQPLGDNDPWAAWLKEHGTSICSICLMTNGPIGEDEAVLKDAGFTSIFKQEKGYEAYEYFDTASVLGTLLEIKERY